MKSGWKFLLSLLTGLPFTALGDITSDKNGANETDRQYIAYLRKQVENGSMSESEAKELLRSKSNYGTNDEYINSLWNESFDDQATFTGAGADWLSGIADRFPALMDSLISYFGHDQLTGAEQQQNAFNAAEAQKSRDFTMYMAQNKYQIETQSMQDAGVNPALVYGGGNLVPTQAGSAQATGSNAAGGDPISALMALVRMPLELKNLKQDLENKQAERALTEQKTETERAEARIRAINANYADAINGQTLTNMKADYENKIADTDYKTANRDYVLTQRDAQSILNKYLDEKTQEEINNLKSSSAKMDAETAKARAEKSYQDWYNNFVRANGFLPSSNDVLMIGTYIASLFGIAKEDVQTWFNDMLDKLPNLGNDKKNPEDYWDKTPKGTSGAAEGGGSR